MVAPASTICGLQRRGEIRCRALWLFLICAFSPVRFACSHDRRSAATYQGRDLAPLSSPTIQLALDLCGDRNDPSNPATLLSGLWVMKQLHPKSFTAYEGEVAQQQLALSRSFVPADCSNIFGSTSQAALDVWYFTEMPGGFGPPAVRPNSAWFTCALEFVHNESRALIADGLRDDRRNLIAYVFALALDDVTRAWRKNVLMERGRVGVAVTPGGGQRLIRKESGARYDDGPLTEGAPRSLGADLFAALSDTTGASSEGTATKSNTMDFAGAATDSTNLTVTDLAADSLEHLGDLREQLPSFWDSVKTLTAALDAHYIDQSQPCNASLVLCGYYLTHRAMQLTSFYSRALQPQDHGMTGKIGGALRRHTLPYLRQPGGSLDERSLDLANEVLLVLKHIVAQSGVDGRENDAALEEITNLVRHSAKPSSSCHAAVTDMVAGCSDW